MVFLRISILLDSGEETEVHMALNRDEVQDWENIRSLKEFLDEWLTERYPNVECYQLIESEEITLAEF